MLEFFRFYVFQYLTGYSRGLLIFVNLIKDFLRPIKCFFFAVDYQDILKYLNNSL
jgi:hypothetical protein